MNLLITGGGGDLAKSIMAELEKDYVVHLQTRSELDVTSIESVTEYFIDKTYNVIINNAGSLYSALVVESDVNKWINDINVNLIGCYLVSRESLLENKNVKIINICSTAAFNNYKDWTSYCASKLVL